MQFILAADQHQAAAALTKRLIDELSANKKVLWLTSGGSNIQAASEIIQAIPDQLTKNLTVLPVDERYGEVGHRDSNWQQLVEAGFNGKQATLLPVLRPGLKLQQVAECYESDAEKALSNNQVVIAQLGVGPDGHIAGILPNSPACDENSKMITAYNSKPYTRLTFTFPGLKRISAAYVLAYGEAKKLALTQLRDKSLSLAQQPAQILKQIAEAYVYNDQIGDN